MAYKSEGVNSQALPSTEKLLSKKTNGYKRGCSYQYRSHLFKLGGENV